MNARTRDLTGIAISALLAALAPLAILCACEGGGAGCPEEGPHECSWDDAFDPGQCPDMSGFEQCVVFVDPSVECSGSGRSWASAKKRVQEAVDAAACGALHAGMCATWQVWLREGTHRVNRGCVEDTLRLRSHVEIYGGFAGDETAVSQRDPGAHPAVLDGEPEGGGGRVNNVVLAQSVAGAVLDGLTIRGGEAAIDAYVCAGGKTMQGGGGVALLDGDLAVRGCAFEGNDSANFGGAISSFFSELAVRDSSFDGNSAPRRGGGIFGTESSLLLEGSSLTGNTVMDDGGGAAFWEGGSAEMSTCLFEGNHATKGADSPPGAAMGGALGVFETIANIHDCQFTGNSADNEGGAIKMVSCELSVADSIFTDNRSVSGDFGGAISTVQGEAVITGCSFIGNRAEAISDDFSGNGGGLEISRTKTITISQCLFEDNLASGDGGAVLLQDVETGLVEHSAFIGNAGNRGGAIADTHDSLSTGGQTVVRHCSFSGNTAGVAGTDVFHTAELAEEGLNIDTTIVASILWSAADPVAWDPADAVPSVTWSDVRGGFEGSGNIDADPLFVDEAGGDLHLAEGSPCIGAAEDGSDMGAYQHDAE